MMKLLRNYRSQKLAITNFKNPKIKQKNNPQISSCKKILILVLLFVSINLISQVSVFKDDFNRGVVVSPLSNGGLPEMTYITSPGGVSPGGKSKTFLVSGSNYSLNLLQNTTTTNGSIFVSGATTTFETPYNPFLGLNTDIVTWSFNLRTNRTVGALSGFNTSSNYGMAVVLAGSSSNLLTGNGYVVTYQSDENGTGNSIYLKKYSGGVTNSGLTNLIGPSENVSNFTNYVSIKVTYNPTGNIWSLYVRDDGAIADVDPSNTATIEDTISDATYTGQDSLLALPYFGFLFKHGTSTASTNQAFYDNFEVKLGNPATIYTPKPSSLAGFYSSNGISNFKSFKVGGTSLTSDVVVTPPAYYQISLDNISYSSMPINITPVNGQLVATILYAKILPGLLPIGTYNNENITITANGAETKNVTCSGYVADTFYYSGSGSLSNVNNWGANTDGTGATPPDFATDFQSFSIRTSISPNVNWNVSGVNSKIIFGDETINPIALTIPAGIKITGTLDVTKAILGGSNKIIVQYDFDNSGTNQPTWGVIHPNTEFEFSGNTNSILGEPNNLFNKTIQSLVIKNGATLKIDGTPNNTLTTASLLVENGGTLYSGEDAKSFINISNGGNATIDGTFKTKKIFGFTSAIGGDSGRAGLIGDVGAINFLSGIDALTLGTNSLVEYNAISTSENQKITPRNNYKNLTFSGVNSTKLLNAGTYTISGILKINSVTGTTVGTNTVPNGSNVPTDNGDGTFTWTPNITPVILGGNPLSISVVAGAIEYNGPGAQTIGANSFLKSTVSDIVLKNNTNGGITLTASEVINNNSQIILSGGNLKTGNTIGYSETTGVLQLTEDSKIVLGTGNHTLHFSDSNLINWVVSKTILITGWSGIASQSGSSGKVYFGTDEYALTPQQLSQISFDGYSPGSMLLSTGQLVPICVPPSEAGSISGEQEICSGNMAAAFTSDSPAIIALGTYNYQWQATTNGSFISIPGATNVTYAELGMLTNTTYYVRLAKASCEENWINSVQSNVIAINITNTWIGVTSANWQDSQNWSCGVAPTLSNNVIIEAGGAYMPEISTADAATKSLFLKSGTTLFVRSGFDLTIKDGLVNNGTLTVENEANLIQINTSANTGNGTTVVKRNTASLFRYDYVMWASPVTNQNLLSFSNATLPNRFYTYDANLNSYTVVPNVVTTNFEKGIGYLIRLPNNHTTSGSGGIFTGIFTGGLPNNGNVSLTVDANVAQYYAIGNPYPSTINANAFMTTNSLTEALYFWRKRNNSLQPSYATYTLAGGVGNSNSGDPLGLTPDGSIQVGQGFIAKSIPNHPLLFTNSMRNGDNAAIFLKQSTDKNRIWLNLTSNLGHYFQTMIAYMPNATLGIDNAIDGRYFNDSPSSLTSMIANEAFTIQGRPLPFVTNDIVSLGFKTDTAGVYTISLHKTDGIFYTGFPIYIIDTLLNNRFDLSTGSYSFTSDSGMYNTRFEIAYEATSLNTTTIKVKSEAIVVYKKLQNIVINAGTFLISNTTVFDSSGRLLVSQKGGQNSEMLIPITCSNQVLLIKVLLEDGTMVTKKMVY